MPDTDVRIAITTSELDFLDEIPPLLRDAARRRDPAARPGRFARAPPRQRAAGAAAAATPRDIAFLTYTSGTTGPSKGAMNSHGNVVFNARATESGSGSTPTTTSCSGVAPFFHITGLVGHLAVALLLRCRW